MRLSISKHFNDTLKTRLKNSESPRLRLFWFLRKSWLETSSMVWKTVYPIESMSLFFIWAKNCGSSFRKSFKNKRMMTVYFLPHRTSNSIFWTSKACTLVVFILAMKFKICNKVSKSSKFRNRSLTEPTVSDQSENF